jgi:hypothetical protein
MLEAGSFASLTASAGGTIEVADDGSFTLPASILTVDQTEAAQTAGQFFTQVGFDFHNGTGRFGGPAHPGGRMPLIGKVRLFAKAFPPASLPITKGFSGLVDTVMVSNGVSTARYALVGSGGWRTGVVTQFGSTGSHGATFDRRTHTGTDGRTPMGIGSMNLVIPIAFRRLVDGALQEQDPVTGILSITFTPEPARLALESASVGALAVLGARRLRRRAAE